MRLSVLFAVAFLFNSGLSFGQLPSKVQKLEGKWRFKEGSGFEVWERKDEKLIGHAFRVTKFYRIQIWFLKQEQVESYCAKHNFRRAF